VPKSETPPAGGRVDFLGGALCALGLGGTIFALIEQPRLGWNDPAVALTFVGGLACLVAFIVHERRTPAPMLPLSLFRERNFAVGNVTTLAMYAGLGGMMFLLGLFIQQVGGYDALEAGAAFLPLTLITFALAKRFGALSDRFGPRAFMGAGPIVAGLGMLLLLRVDADADYLTQLLPGIVVFGFGLALTVAPLTAAVLASVDDKHSGIASGVNNAVARVAGLLAIAALGTVVASQFAKTIDEKVGSNAPASAIAAAKDRPLAVSDATPQLRAATRDASVDSFRLGVGIAALLTIGGGVIAAVGIQNPRRVVVAEECAGGPICGAPASVEPLPEAATAATA
jgi:Na+/melibiose symporter-like transporter